MKLFPSNLVIYGILIPKTGVDFVKKIIAALALGMMIGSATTALAAPDVVEATVAKFKFIVNGQQKEVATEQLVVMGTTYLPVREISNMLGYDVTYKKDANTIELDNGTASPSAESSSANDSQNAIEDVNNVTLTTDYISADEARAKGISFETTNNNTIVVSYENRSLEFPVLTEGHSAIIKGGYGMITENGILYISTSAETYLLG
jgi:hypothetical protein